MSVFRLGMLICRMKIAVGDARLKDELRVLEVSAESGAEMRG